MRAVLAGLAVDLGGSTLVSIVLTLVHASSLAGSGLSEAEVQQALQNIPADSAIAILGTLLGAACSVAGGFVCARVARRDEYRPGVVMACLSAFLSSVGGPADTPGDLALLLTLSTLACVLLGVKYGRERNRRPDPPAPSPPGGPTP